MSAFKITAVGEIALEIISEEQNASVIGLTSRGVFCATGQGQILFLSYESWRGPLTINLNLPVESKVDPRYIMKEHRSHPQAFDRLTYGSLLSLSNELLRFKKENISIIIASVPAWRADLRPIKKAGLADAQASLERVAKKLLAEGSVKGWIGCIPRWAGFDFLVEKDDAALDVDDELQCLADGLRSGNRGEILLHTGRLLGRGTGLTPSGDDFLIGLLLGLRVTKEFSPVWSIFNDISVHWLPQARQKTTTLANNLLIGAMRGQADERLVTSLEGILWGSLPVEECARRLLDYGGSSGADTLLGVAMALSLG